MVAFPFRTPSRWLLAMALVAATIGSAEAQYSLRAASTERVGRDLVTKQLFGKLTALFGKWAATLSQSSSLEAQHLAAKQLFGNGANRDRLARLESLMQATYAGLPKNKYGGVDQAVALYALHRYFLLHRGWHIRGIAPDGERWNASSSTAMLKSRMPTLVLEMLEERVGRS